MKKKTGIIISIGSIGAIIAATKLYHNHQKKISKKLYEDYMLNHAHDIYRMENEQEHVKQYSKSLKK